MQGGLIDTIDYEKTQEHIKNEFQHSERDYHLKQVQVNYLERS